MGFNSAFKGLITRVREGWNAVTLQLLDSKQFTKTSDH